MGCGERGEYVMKTNPEQERPCMTRREFLLASGSVTLTTVFLSSLPGVLGRAEAVPATLATYPKKKIGKVSALKTDKPVFFNYPFDGMHSQNMLVKLGAPASGGVGPKQDIVAFSTLCTHMGGPLAGTYKSRDKVLGPCPLHMTLFDLTRHGMVVAGHATESLPQVVLEVKGDDIYATGVLGLIYGTRNNLDTGK